MGNYITKDKIKHKLNCINTLLPPWEKLDIIIYGSPKRYAVVGGETQCYQAWGFCTKAELFYHLVAIYNILLLRSDNLNKEV